MRAGKQGSGSLVGDRVVTVDYKFFGEVRDKISASMDQVRDGSEPVLWVVGPQPQLGVGEVVSARVGDR